MLMVISLSLLLESPYERLKCDCHTQTKGNTAIMLGPMWYVVLFLDMPRVLVMHFDSFCCILMSFHCTLVVTVSLSVSSFLACNSKIA